MSKIQSSGENITINADGANNDIKFQSNGSEVASIDQAGNVLAAGTVTSNGQAQLNNNNLIGANTGSTSEWIGKRTSSGEGIHITTTNAAGADTQRLAITCNADSADFIVKASDIVLGTAGKGIVLGATSNVDANTLDDYEQGTWSPRLHFDGATTGIAYGSGYSTGWYTKVGNLVTYGCMLLLSSKGSANGSAQIRGLPFAIADIVYHQTTAAFNPYHVSFADQIMCYLPRNNTAITLRESTNAGNLSDITNANISDDSQFNIQGSYITSS